jgi:hypothetical protein
MSAIIYYKFKLKKLDNKPFLTICNGSFMPEMLLRDRYAWNVDLLLIWPQGEKKASVRRLSYQGYTSFRRLE